MVFWLRALFNFAMGLFTRICFGWLILNSRSEPNHENRISSEETLPNEMLENICNTGQISFKKIYNSLNK